MASTPVTASSPSPLWLRRSPPPLTMPLSQVSPLTNSLFKRRRRRSSSPAPRLPSLPFFRPLDSRRPPSPPPLSSTTPQPRLPPHGCLVFRSPPLLTPPTASLFYSTGVAQPTSVHSNSAYPLQSSTHARDSFFPQIIQIPNLNFKTGPTRFSSPTFLSGSNSLTEPTGLTGQHTPSPFSVMSLSKIKNYVSTSLDFRITCFGVSFSCLFTNPIVFMVIMMDPLLVRPPPFPMLLVL